jgi:hypothetical protein
LRVGANLDFFLGDVFRFDASSGYAERLGDLFLREGLPDPNWQALTLPEEARLGR